MRTLAARSAVVTLGVLTLLGVLAAPASAHTISGPRPTNYRSSIVAIDPAAPGVTVRILDLGAKTQLTNHTASEVTVLGYDDEPYLRIGRDGVFENIHSAATYINRTAKGSPIPPDVDTSATVAPEWRKISDANSWTWHNHQAHYMGTKLPPVVANDPGAFHRITVGHFKFVHNGTTSDVAIAIDWVPGPSGMPWVPVAIVVFGAALFVAIGMRRWRSLAVVVGCLVVLDAAHAIAFEIARPGSVFHRIAQFVGDNFVSIVVWAAAIVTIIGLWRRRAEALYGVVFVGLMLALVGGATDLSALWKSQLPAVGPAVVGRIEVVLLLAGGAGIAIGGLVRVVRVERARRASLPSAADGGWLRTLVVGLSDKELRRIAAELDVDEVLTAAMREAAARLDARVDAFAAGAVVVNVVADDDAGAHTWSIRAVGGACLASNERVEPVAVELNVPFSLWLQILAGTVALTDAITNQRVKCSGDVAVAMAISPYLGEVASPHATDPAAPTDPAPAP